MLRFAVVGITTLYLSGVTMVYCGGRVEATNKNGNLESMPINYSKTRNIINSNLLKTPNFSKAEIEKNALFVLTREPLSDKAVYHLAYARKLKTESIANEKLLKLALLRNPRNRSAHKALIIQYFSENKYEQSVVHILSLLNLSKSVQSNYLKPLVHIYIENIARNVIETELMANPYWGKSFFLYLFNETPKSSLPSYSGLMRRLKKNAPNHLSNLILSNYISLLYTNQHKELAYKVWKEFDDAAPSKNSSATYINRPKLTNPNFNSQFNWQLNNNATVSTKFESSGIYVYSNGRSESVAFSQVFLLPHNLPLYFSYIADYSPKLNSSYFEWRFSCAETGRIFSSYKLEKNHTAGAPIQHKLNQLEMPCKFVKLDLVSIPGHYPKTIQGYFTYVNVTQTSN